MTSHFGGKLNRTTVKLQFKKKNQLFNTDIVFLFLILRRLLSVTKVTVDDGESLPGKMYMYFSVVFKIYTFRLIFHLLQTLNPYSTLSSCLLH
jgi:hypothetical protein